MAVGEITAERLLVAATIKKFKMDTFKVELIFSGEHNVEPEKKPGETINFGAGGDTTADYIIRRFITGMRAVLAEYKHTSLDKATLIHSPEIQDDLLSGYRLMIQKADVVKVETPKEEPTPRKRKPENGLTVKEDVETDFTGLPAENPFDPSDYE